MKCSECENGTAIYQCPKCNHRTCSMTCCQMHKQRTGCNGKRNRAPFQRLEEMNDATIRNDYFFLEDVIRNVDGGKRLVNKLGAVRGGGTPSLITHVDPNKDIPDDNEPNLNIFHHKRQKTTTTTTTEFLPPRWRRLVHEACRRNITLLLMPQGMTRHKTNTTYYRHQTNTLMWKLEFVLHDGCVTNHLEDNDDIDDTTSPTTKVRTLFCDQVSEDSILKEEWNKKLSYETNLNKYMVHGTAYDKLNKEGTADDESKQDDHIHFLMKHLPCPANQPKYIELRPDASFKELFHNRTIIEFPTIDVVPKKLLHQFSRVIEEVT
jgi:hypothetical protein